MAGVGLVAPSSEGGFGFDAAVDGSFQSSSVAANLGFGPPLQPQGTAGAGFGGFGGFSSEGGFGFGAHDDFILFSPLVQANDVLGPLRGQRVKVKRTSGVIEPFWQLALDAQVDV